MNAQNKAEVRLKVLVVDDERVIADTLATILVQNGFDATAVYNGLEAVDTACVWQPDIVLTDVVMPALDGIEAVIRICKLGPECRVVLMSGNLRTVELWENACRLGHSFELLQKPVPPEELLAHLRAIT